MAVTITDTSVAERLLAGAAAEGISVETFVDRLIDEHEQRRTDLDILNSVGQGEPLLVDEHLDRRLVMLLDEAYAEGSVAEMTAEDWAEIRRQGDELSRRRRA